MRVGEQELRRFAGDVLLASGASREQAEAVAEVLVWCDAVGRGTQGVWRLPILSRRLRSGAIRGEARPRLERRGPALALVEGDGGSGHFVARRAMEWAISMAREAGSATVLVRASNFFGAGAFYVEQAARAGMLGMALSNSFPKVAAHGGTRAALGTNPFAFGAPRANGESILVDMATSASAGSTVRKLQETGGELPADVAADAAGRPLTRPEKVAEGALLPLGGAKGFALALFVEIAAGVVSGAGVADGVRSMYGEMGAIGDNGHLLWALDVARVMPMAAYHAVVERLVAAVKSSGDPGGVLVPGERRWASARESRASGVALDEPTRKGLEALALDLGIAVPWPT